MKYINHYDSPLGKILLSADETGLTGLWFEGQIYSEIYLSDAQNKECTLPVFCATKKWLDIYFEGREPDFIPPLHIMGTEFQKEVFRCLSEIPYGSVVTYDDIAAKIAQKCKTEHMSARAVGSAVGRNSISIIIPCHRVIGKNGSLTGYAGGTDRKLALLKLEGVTGFDKHLL